jgi:hypothetical protein
MARCRVSYNDMDGVTHAIDVEADSLYEAVALAFAEFPQEDIKPVTPPSAMTEFNVMVYRPAVEHKVRLGQVFKWAEHTVKEGPAGIIKRQRVRMLLGENG